jgi:hypothetical protein
MNVSDKIEDYQFEARVQIRCGCGRNVSIGPNAVTGDCWGCGRIYRTSVEVMDPEILLER